MWTLISRMNLGATRRRLARRMVAATVVFGTVTQAAMALLPKPAFARPEAATITASDGYEIQCPADHRVG